LLHQYDRLTESLAQLPDAPGIYQMLDEKGKILYIGKAISLRSRVRSYFQNSADLGPRKHQMVQRVHDVRTIVVGNEVEALILEANLIKLHQPQFNVRLRDDKRFPYLKVTNEPFPRVMYTRHVVDDGARYFGPYTNAHGLRELTNLLRIVFPMRTCREPIDGKRPRPCLQYHIKRCLAPCVGYQTENDYDRIVDEVVLFLEGRQEALISRLQTEMSQAAETLNYETAARLRDRILAVRRVTEGQRVVWRSRIDMDLIALARSHGQACVQVFFVRYGKLMGQEHFILDGVAEESDAQILEQFLAQFYQARAADVTPESANEGSPLGVRQARSNEAPVAKIGRARSTNAIPKEILLSTEVPSAEPIEKWLSTLKGQRVRILVPQRGERLSYLSTVRENAEQNLKSFLAHQEAQESASAQSLAELSAALGLPAPPQRIECYDISNIQGTNAVASMVVFVDGRSKKSAYRRFKIRYDRGPNDFAMMKETLRRRLRYLVVDEDADIPASRAERFSERPDLLLIDGGKGQLHAVVEVLDELDLRGIPVAGLAKEHEWLFLPGQSEPIILPPHSAGLHLIMRVRDEAHRFAIEFHRSLRAKAMIRSALDDVEGIGPTRKKRLMKTFGTVGAIAKASLDSIAAVKGMTPELAARVKSGLQ
jgi:excinuclease ABC subunit C